MRVKKERTFRDAAPVMCVECGTRLRGVRGALRRPWRGVSMAPKGMSGGGGAAWEKADTWCRAVVGQGAAGAKRGFGP